VEASRFGMLYLGETLKVCFLEAVLRDQRDGVVGSLPIREDELDRRLFADIEVAAPLRLVDLREDRAVLMGVPSDVHRASHHTLGRAWSVAFYGHPLAPDGIIYPSRLNGHTNPAVYDRAVPKLRPVRVRKLLAVPELTQVLDELEVELVTPDPPDPRA
jgi:RES domain